MQSNFERYVDRRLGRPGIFWGALLLALLIHLVSVYVVAPYLDWQNAEAQRRREEPIEIVAAPNQRQKQKPVVQTSRDAQTPDDKSQARFDGEFRNRVKKETQAANRSRFRENQRPRQQSRPGEQGDGVGAQHLQMSDLMPSGNPRDLGRDVATGAETHLNTDEVHYASFLNRIADEVYGPWVRQVTDVIRSPTSHKLSPIDYVTRIEIVMDAAGHVTTINIIKSCGVPELDEAARRAFLEVEPFRHPPKELINAAGEVRLAYGLQVELGRSFFNISR